MKKGICTLSIVPVRLDPDDKSEMVSQLLFGETYRVLKKNGKWCQIQMASDDYSGWIDLKQHTLITDKEFEKLQEESAYLAYDLSCHTDINDYQQALLMGSSLPHFDGMTFKVGGKKGLYNGQVVEPGLEKNHLHIIKIAKRYLNAPYLWGGRSPFGIDCSGFTQMVYKFVGIYLKRDTYQQAQEGRLVQMLASAKEGDLAFFVNKDDRISHVGILMGNDQIIHASGKVRIDRIDNYGIYNESASKYTHKLSLIKRLI